MIRTMLALLYNTVLVAASAYALVRGRAPERVGAAINLFASGVSYLALPTVIIARWQGVDAVNLAVDVSVAVSFFALACRSDRFWPVWAFGFALANLLMHFGRFAVQHQVALAYANASVIWAYLALVSLVLGTRYEARGEVAGARLPDRAAKRLRKLLE